MRSVQSFGFPPFAGGVKKLIILQTAIFLILFALNSNSDATVKGILNVFALNPQAVVHGQIWQLVTYGFIHLGLGHIFFNMLTLWMFGATLEQDWGTKRFYEFYFLCLGAAAVATTALAYTHMLGMSPDIPTIGASGGIFGLIVAFGMLHAEQRVYIYAIFPIKAKWLAIFFVSIALLGAISNPYGGVNNVAHLGGAIFGYIYLKFLPRRGLRFSFSENWYGMRNRYYKWKRRQAAKKFEVYMREHDKGGYFDKHGDYRDPESKKDDDPKGPWVN